MLIVSECRRWTCKTKQDVILSSDGSVIDTGRLPKVNGLKVLMDTVNCLLASLSGSGSTVDPPESRSVGPSNQPPLPKKDPPRPPKNPLVPEPDTPLDPPLDPPNDLRKPPSLPPSGGGDVVDKGKSFEIDIHVAKMTPAKE